MTEYYLSTATANHNGVLSISNWQSCKSIYLPARKANNSKVLSTEVINYK